MTHANLLYVQMRDYLLDLIRQNQSTPNFRLPSENQLAIKFGASRISARHAFDLLEKERLIYRQRGRGSFIAPYAAQAASSPERASPGDPVSAPIPCSVTGAPRENTVALILPRVNTRFMSDIVTGVWEALQARNLQMALFLTGDDQEKEVAFLYTAQARLRGALLFPGSYATYHEEVLRLVLTHFPLVLIDRYLPGLNLSYVACDHFHATYRAVQFLRARGHQRIGFVGPLVGHASSIRERCNAFDQAMHEQDAAYPDSFKMNIRETPENFDALFAQYMRAMNPTALISTSHLHAGPIVRVLRALGREREIELMLYDDEFRYAHDFLERPPFVIDQQPLLIGRSAAELVYRLACQNGKPSRILLHERIIRA